ncbi:hypothetical protein A9K65_008400 [Mesorhizobium sp. WSM1497]|nr:hypothetical protein A9K65_008400 [Mesorhizobium sp. WSM1497]
MSLKLTFTASLLALATSLTMERVLADEPKELNIAAIFSVGLDQPWDKSWYEAFQRVKALKPHGLEINLKYSEHVWGDKAEAVMKSYAEAGKFDVIIATSTFSDQVKALRERYPNIIWEVHGSGNEGLGGNMLWYYMRVHEPAYLMGMVAGLTTKNNMVGVVGSFPADDANDEINAFLKGAHDVNPNVKGRVTFIQAWYDPQKANEASYALIAAGADNILQLGGAFQACIEKNIQCYGNFVDMNSLAPNNIVTSTVAKWDPTILNTIDVWYRHETEAKKIEASTDPVWFGMKDGGSDLAPFHGFTDKLPPDVIQKVNAKRADIMSGAFTVPLNTSEPKSD